MTPEHFKIIFYIVVALFVITFLFTLLTLPGWIKVDDKYRKPLFYGFIIELGLAFFAFFKMSDPAYITDPPQSDWVGLNLETKKLVQPALYIEGDTAGKILTRLGKTKQDAEGILNDNQLILEMSDDNGLQIKSDSNQILGKIPKKRFNYFNTIITDQQELVSQNVTTVKFESDSLGKWDKSRYDFLDDGSGFDVIVQDYDTLTGYKIIQRLENEEQKVWFNSIDNIKTAKILFNLDSRIIHSYEYDNNFYLLFVRSANLNKRTDSNGNRIPRYVQFQQLKLEPYLKNKDAD